MGHTFHLSVTMALVPFESRISTPHFCFQTLTCWGILGTRATLSTFLSISVVHRPSDAPILRSLLLLRISGTQLQLFFSHDRLLPITTLNTANDPKRWVRNHHLHCPAEETGSQRGEATGARSHSKARVGTRQLAHSPDSRCPPGRDFLATSARAPSPKPTASPGE